jgi:hypothetical protein
MALSNFSKAKIYALFNNTSTGAAPTTYLAFFAGSTEVLPYATRPQVNFTYDDNTHELRNVAANFGNATNTVTGITTVRVYDAASGGNELFTLTADATFGFTQGEEASYDPGDLVLDLIVATQPADIEPIVIDKYGEWIAGTASNGFPSAVVALLDGGTEVTGVAFAARVPVTINTTTGVNSNELDFGQATAQVSFDEMVIYSGTDLLATGGQLTPSVVNVSQNTEAKVQVGGLTIAITAV